METEGKTLATVRRAPGGDHGGPELGRTSGPDVAALVQATISADGLLPVGWWGQ